MSFKTCSKCGIKTTRAVHGMCLPCYQRERYAREKADGKQPTAEPDPPPSMAPDEMFECKKYRCRMQVRHCLEYQKAAVEQGDADYFRAGRLTVDRRPCLDCEQGKVIAASVGTGPAKADAPPENSVGMMAECQNKGKDQRSALGVGQSTGKAEIVQPRGDQAAIRANEGVGETMKTEVEEMKGAKIEPEVSNDPPVMMCRQCGGRPAVNPVSRLCSECHSAWLKTRNIDHGKRKSTPGWLWAALRDRPEVYEQIQEQARREFRTPELQALWILSKAVEE